LGKAKGALVSESALHSFDGGKPNSVGPESIRGRMIIYLSRPALAGQKPVPHSRDMVRRYPRINIRPAALPLLCLAPHGVFRASRIASRAVSSYLAFSPLPALCCQRTGGVFSVTLSVAAVFQPQRPRTLRGMPPYGVRTFLQQVLRLTSDHLPSRGSISQPGKPENRRE
jgi:hypothetical protein